MTPAEYNARRADILKRSREEQRKLNIEFALSKNTVKIGDLVSDRHVTIRVESIDVETPLAFPQMAYSGQSFESMPWPGKVYQRDVIKHIKE